MAGTVQIPVPLVGLKEDGTPISDQATEEERMVEQDMEVYRLPADMPQPFKDAGLYQQAWSAFIVPVNQDFTVLAQAIKGIGAKTFNVYLLMCLVMLGGLVLFFTLERERRFIAQIVVGGAFLVCAILIRIEQCRARCLESTAIKGFDEASSLVRSTYATDLKIVRKFVKNERSRSLLQYCETFQDVEWEVALSGAARSSGGGGAAPLLPGAAPATEMV